MTQRTAVHEIEATGVPSASTFLRGDGTWSTSAGGNGTLLSPAATISTTKAAGNPTLNEVGALPENIIRVGTTYWLVYCHPNPTWTAVDVRLASASSPAGPWTPYGGNPVLTTGSQSWEAANVANGVCLVENGGTFYLYYGVEAGSGTVSGIGVATATTVTGPYTKSASNPVLSPSAGTNWDSLRVCEPSVVLVDGTWVMAYMGESSTLPKNQTEQVGIATATNPLGPWTRIDPATPQIRFGAPGSFDAGCIADPSLFYENGVYYCIYTGKATWDAALWVIGLATATDLAGPWTRHPDSPILGAGPSGAFDAAAVFRGAIFRDGDTYHLPYAGVPASDNAADAKGGNATLVITDGAAPTYLTQVSADARYVRTVNGTAPDGSGNVTATSGGGAVELLMQDGVTGPPVPLETEARDDWLYQG